MENNQNNFQTPDTSAVKKDSGTGPIIGSIIIIILIVLGGLYFWGYIIKKQHVEAPITNESTSEQVPSEEVADPDVAEINNELNSTNVDDVDSDMNEIDAEIDAAFE